MAALSLAIMVAGKLYGRTLVRAGHTSATERYDIVVGNDVVSVPANMIRKQNQRRSGETARLDIYLHWPTISGFSDRLSAEFNNVDPATNSILFVSIMPRATTRDMAGRFDPVYRQVVTGAATPAPGGLRSFALSEEHGYINERLVYSSPDKASGRRFVARCQDTGKDRIILAPCETDIHFGETLSAHIRFPARLLDEWRGLHVALPVFLRSLLVRSAD
ncbi:hypothetical protein [Oricola thermophila]|uniref:Uncharacterized protein n=1 Tax=Oricola thermophila TaxID=2742145 RepID=A0A6N1VAP2_9HYPH|nr:hypothetical protein [Oricola thermophila]QKV18071.1 hypothetical protein HTY61_06165 [Oricola thermophila]